MVVSPLPCNLDGSPHPPVRPPIGHPSGGRATPRITAQRHENRMRGVRAIAMSKPSEQTRQHHSSHRWGHRLRGLAIALVGASTLAVTGASSATALDQVQVRYGPLGVSASLDDLKAFADGEDTSSSFRAVLRMMENYGGLSSDAFRTLLTQEVNLGMLGIDSKVMYGFVGTRILERISNLIYPPYDRGNVYALRGALALSLADDGKLSALEVLENYGPQTMRIDAAGIQGSINEFKGLLNQL